jgi:hypothetical protein
VPGKIKLEPGPANAIWDSNGIRLRSSRETNLQSIGNHIRPVSGQSYYTYVKVTNIGTDPLGPCQCNKTGQWANVTLFIDTFNPMWPILAPDGASRLTYFSSTDQFQLEDVATGAPIAGPWFRRGKTATGAQTGLNSFWAWSPNGLFFAVVVRDTQAGGGGSWWLEVCATRQYTRANGTRTISRGSILSLSGVSTAANVIAGVNLGWNSASTCLELRPPPIPSQPLTQANLTLICPYADSGSNTAPTYTWPALDTASAKVSGWAYYHSPCGTLFALVPRPIPGTASAALNLQIFDIYRTLQNITQRRDNLPVAAAQISTAGATLTTASPGRRGIKLTNMSLSEIDNPECSAGTPARVNVRRVRVSTIPNQIDYTNLGQTNVAIWPNNSLWVEFPSLQWINPAGSPGQLHYCLQANGDAAPDDPSPGWGNLDLNDPHFAQRNIVFA